MPLPPLLPIQPFTRPVHGEAAVPGSKSLTNRALLLAALGRAKIRLTGALFSDDTRIMADALRRLGFEVTEDASHDEISIAGRGGEIPCESAELFVGLAGTAARFLTALCAAAPRGVYRLDGVEQMRKRPMAGLIEALRSQGADIRCLGAEGHFPLEIRAHGLRGGPVKIDASESSQMLSALMLVAPLAAKPLSIETISGVRKPFVEMTRRLMAEFKAKGQDTFAIEPDATAASYFLALPLATRGSLLLRELRVASGQTLQGDAAFADVLNEAGARVEAIDENPPDGGGPESQKRVSTGRAGVRSLYGGTPPLRGVARNFSEMSDTFLTLAALSPLLTGQTDISGIAHTRKQETDRVSGCARELRKLGQHVAETEDSLVITPRPEAIRRLALAGPIEIETYGDHRFAMSFAILGCHDLRGDGRPWIAIKDPACSAKTFPHFFELLEELRTNSLKA